MYLNPNPDLDAEIADVKRSMLARIEVGDGTAISAWNEGNGASDLDNDIRDFMEVAKRAAALQALVALRALDVRTVPMVGFGS